MIKLKNTKDLPMLAHLEEEIQQNALDTLQILDSEYGEDRDIIRNLGGYVVFAESEEDLRELEVIHNTNFTDNPTTEYVDIIDCESGRFYTSSLFLLSSDYGILIILAYEMTPQGILNHHHR